MKGIYWLIEAAASFSECICCYYLLSCLNRKRKASQIKTVILYSLILTVFILFMNGFVLSSLFTVFLAAGFVSISLRMSSSVPVYETFPLVCFYYSYMNAIDFLCVTLIGNLIGDIQFLNRITMKFSPERILFIVVSKICLILCTLLLKQVIVQLCYTLKYFWIVSFFGGIGSMYLIKLTIISITPEIVLNWGSLLTLMMLLVFVLGLCERYRKEKEEKRMVQLSNKIIQDQYKALMENNDSIKKLQHDFKNHMYILQELLLINKFEEAKEYLNNIGISIYEKKNDVWTGNLIIDFIINYKKTIADEKGIRFSIKADRVFSKKIRDEDMCVVLANLLDNAIEAAQMRNDGWIQVAVRSMEGLLIIKIQNSIGVLPVSSGSALQTIKRDKELHGIGLSSVQAVVDKYEGEFHYTYDGNAFLAMVTFFDS